MICTCARSRDGRLQLADPACTECKGRGVLAQETRRQQATLRALAAAHYPQTPTPRQLKLTDDRDLIRAGSLWYAQAPGRRRRYVEVLAVCRPKDRPAYVRLREVTSGRRRAYGTTDSGLRRCAVFVAGLEGFASAYYYCSSLCRSDTSSSR